DLLIHTHRALYPLVDRQRFYDTGGKPEGGRHPVERAIAYLTGAYPLETPEWSAWSANLRPAQVEGRWAMTGHQPGRGAVFGTMEVRSVPGRPDEFTTAARYVYAADGSVVDRSG